MSINEAVNIQTELEDVHQGELTVPLLYHGKLHVGIYIHCLAVVEKNQPGPEVIYTFRPHNNL